MILWIAVALLYRKEKFLPCVFLDSTLTDMFHLRRHTYQHTPVIRGILPLPSVFETPIPNLSQSLVSVLQAPLPDLNLGIYPTRSSALQQKRFLGPLIYWIIFEGEVNSPIQPSKGLARSPSNRSQFQIKILRQTNL